MKINLDTDALRLNQNANDHLRIDKSQNQTAKTIDAAASAGFALSVGMGGESGLMSAPGIPVSDLAAGLSETDVQLKTDYMSVMSLSMSDEDYAEMVRTGKAPEDMDASDCVTILDDIKAALIRGGADIAGYTDTLDADTLAQITGSETSANALIKKISDAGLDLDQLDHMMRENDVPLTADNLSGIADAVTLTKEVLPISDETAAFLAGTSKSPTIQNVYQTANSGAFGSQNGGAFYSEDGYVTRMAGSEGIDELREQIEETITASGLEVNDKTLSDAKLLIGSGFPFTSETLLKLDSLDDLRSDMSAMDIAKSVVIGMSAGIPAMKANLTYDRSIYTQADEIASDIMNIPDEAVDKAVSDGLSLNMRNLKAVVQDMGADTISQRTDTATDQMKAGQITEQGLTADQLHARRLMEEARITMSVQANRILLKSNYQIDIAPMEELVEALKEAEQAFGRRLFADSDETEVRSKAALYRETNTVVEDIYSAPAAILGQYKAAGILRFGVGETYTISEVYEAGTRARQDYVRAGETYEALMTAPRADMGDSVKKAFRNVDDILNDLQIETDELNRRAVRILGYNSMEITAVSIEQVREADINLRSVINRLTPDRVLSMIRENVNPLDMTIQEMSEYLDEQDRDPERQAADYARFLMQLERQNEITELERDSYIGIYRMISKLDRTEDASIGKLLAMGREISFENLLSAMRSTQKGYMDYKIDDSFEGVDSIRRGAAIDDQIKAAFSVENTIRNTPVNETVIENLLMSGSEVSVSNLRAMDLIKKKRADYIRPIADRLASKSLRPDSTSSGTAWSGEANDVILSEAKNPTALDTLTDALVDSMTDRDSAIDGYLGFMDSLQAELTEAMYETADLIDIRAIQSSVRQVGQLKSMANDERYDIPVEFDGEYTSIRLTMKHESGAGKVAITMTTVSIGTVASEFSYSNGMSGYIAYEQAEAAERLKARAAELTEALGFMPELISVRAIDTEKYTDQFASDEKSAKNLKEEADPSDINNIELYRVARSFIRILKNC